MTVATAPPAGPITALAALLAVRRRWAAALGSVVLLALSVLQRLDLALSAAHPPGAVAGGIGDIASPFRLGSADHAVAVARGWVEYQSTLPAGARSVRWMTVGYLFGDLVLMTALTLLLALWWARSVRKAAAQQYPAPQQAALANAVRLTWMPLLAYLPADLVETVLATGQWQGLDPSFAQVIAGASLAKWTALLLVAVPLLIAELLTLAPVTRRVLRALRGQFLVGGLLVVVLLALSGELGLQVDDLLIRSAEEPARIGWATAAAVLCAVTLYLGGRMRVQAYINAPLARPIPGAALLLLGAAGGAGLGAGIMMPLRSADQAPYAGSWHVLALAGGLLLLYTLTSAPAGVRRYRDLTPVDVPVAQGDVISQATSWIAVLGTLPPLALALAVARAATSQSASGGPLGTTSRMTIWVLLLLATAAAVVWALGVVSSQLLGPGADPSWLSVAGTLLAGVGGSLALALAPVQGLARTVGAAAVLLLFCTLLALTATGLVALGDLMPARGSLAVLGFRRTPFIGLVLVLVVGASLVDRDGVYFDAVTAQDRDLPRPPGLAALPLVKPENAFGSWAALHARTPGGAGQERPVVPLVFVAAAGGGIKAAYWTASGMSCAVGDGCSGTDRTDQVFLASGVSGGSLGLAVVRGHQEDPAQPAGRDWYDRALGRDYVSPSVATFLFRDLPNSVLRLPRPQDNRASALQDAWQSGMPALKNPFYRPTLTGPRRFPYLVLNGASVEDGCRMAVSELRLAPAAEDQALPQLCAGDDASTAPGLGPRAYPVRNASDYLCERVYDDEPVPDDDPRVASNIRLSTAALLSARFPYVSPSGDLSRCGSLLSGKVDVTGKPLRRYSDEHTYVVDGGLFDNSGATAVTQVWEEIAPAVAAWNDPDATGQACVVPRLLVLDNHYDAQEAPSTAQRPQQLTAPPSARNRVYDLRSTLPLARAEATFRAAAAEALTRCGPDRDEDAVQARLAQDPAVVVLHPVQRPGSKAPLGWTLSNWSRRDMDGQLTTGNVCARQQVRAWFGEELSPRDPAADRVGRCARSDAPAGA